MVQEKRIQELEKQVALLRAALEQVERVTVPGMFADFDSCVDECPWCGQCWDHAPDCARQNALESTK